MGHRRAESHQTWGMRAAMQGIDVLLRLDRQSPARLGTVIARFDTAEDMRLAGDARRRHGCYLQAAAPLLHIEKERR